MEAFLGKGSIRFILGLSPKEAAADGWGTSRVGCLKELISMVLLCIVHKHLRGKEGVRYPVRVATIPERWFWYFMDTLDSGACVTC